MASVCNYCGRAAIQIGKGLFYCRDCDVIITPDEEEKHILNEM